jgi:hypothetical protein
MVVAFPDESLPSSVVAQLHSSRERGVIRVLDGGMLIKGDEGDIELRAVIDLPLDDTPFAGSLARALFESDAETGTCSGAAIAGNGPNAFGLTGDDLAEIIDAVPRASAALVLLIEHRWIAGFAESVIDDRGTFLAQGCITPETVRDACGARCLEIL